MEYAVTTRNLTKKYGTEISVSNMNLTVPQNCIYGFLGPNGAGKTTTMKMILGLVHPTSGKVKVLDKELNTKNRLGILGNIGSLIESPSYYGHLTARENLEIVCTLRNLPKSEIEEVLSIVRLQGETKKVVSKFSLGMKQRLGIATALLGKPPLLLLDEPTNGLDPSGIFEIRELIKSLPKRYGMTVLISSHLLAEIDQIADYVSIINHGEIIFQDSLDVLHQKSNPHLAVRTTDNYKAIKIFSEFKKDGDWLLLPYLSDESLAEISMSLAKNDVIMLRIEKRELSLEEIFLSMTSEKEVLL